MNIVTWNMGCIHEKEKLAPTLKSMMSGERLDAICLQEYITDMPELERYIAGQTQLKHFHKQELSDSHEAPGRKMGTAVFCRYPLRELSDFQSEIDLEALHAGSGRMERLHRKGFNAYSVSNGQGELTLINGHWFPFHRYCIEEQSYGMYYGKLEQWLLTAAFGKKTIVCADFNTEMLPVLLPDFCREFQTVTDGPTHHNHIYDYIFVKNGISCLNFQTALSQSDHAFCRGSYDVRRQR